MGSATYYAKHRDERKAHQCAYYAAHREESKARVYDYWSRRQKWFRKWTELLRITQGCAVCGTHEGRLEYHHIVPATKLYKISNMATCSEETFLDEVAKCDPLCRSCHMRRHQHMRRGDAVAC